MQWSTTCTEDLAIIYKLVQKWTVNQPNIFFSNFNFFYCMAKKVKQKRANKAIPPTSYMQLEFKLQVTHACNAQPCMH